MNQESGHTAEPAMQKQKDYNIYDTDGQGEIMSETSREGCEHNAGWSLNFFTAGKGGSPAVYKRHTAWVSDRQQQILGAIGLNFTEGRLSRLT